MESNWVIKSCSPWHWWTHDGTVKDVFKGTVNCLWAWWLFPEQRGLNMNKKQRGGRETGAGSDADVLSFVILGKQQYVNARDETVRPGLSPAVTVGRITSKMNYMVLITNTNFPPIRCQREKMIGSNQWWLICWQPITARRTVGLKIHEGAAWPSNLRALAALQGVFLGASSKQTGGDTLMLLAATWRKQTYLKVASVSSCLSRRCPDQSLLS